MRALVIYESMFGNTWTVADAIADGVGTRFMVESIEVSEAPTVIGEEFDLVIVGGPTHQFGMSRPGSRGDAAKQADRALISREIGIREWLDRVTLNGQVTAAAFDTQMSEPRWLRFVGSAAGKIEKKLKRIGFTVAVPAKHFYVTGMKGPLADGEIQRARQWGEQIASAVATSVPDYQVA